jgi:uncharacterized protein with PIN domain
VPHLPCPGCGRHYDEARFAGGRTLTCACGARVGRRLPVARGAGPPRFQVDAMLGGLARWLRVLGYDAAWEAEIADPELVRRGVEEGRWILTRDRRLAEEWWVEGMVLPGSDDPLAQLREVAEAVELSTAGIFTRCLRCNVPLRALPPEQAGARVPPAVRARGGPLAECPACARAYWEGSHTARMRREVERALGQGGTIWDGSTCGTC